ncbi:hypothetical protein IMCC3317_17680 [Kordia antarctica]|uniref:Uncharacterized protein n=1 Tax=Kordia antarctica TaxID=1218801 RepID=A0A7L4ZIH6_9FLAO|nr:hypothetical protein IMCC3317_17680 [Kordia antarctica]
MQNKNISNSIKECTILLEQDSEVTITLQNSFLTITKNNFELSLKHKNLNLNILTHEK